MRLPRDISGNDRADALRDFGYQRTPDRKSHPPHHDGPGRHHVTVPCHPSLRIGTLNGILTEVGKHFGISKTDVLRRLFP